jgi:hypothetical protein
MLAGPLGPDPEGARGPEGHKHWRYEKMRREGHIHHQTYPDRREGHIHHRPAGIQTTAVGNASRAITGP